jgi:hypothetical protein
MSKNVSFSLFLKAYSKQTINQKINCKVYLGLLDLKKQGVFISIKKKCNFFDGILNLILTK